MMFKRFGFSTLVFSNFLLTSIVWGTVSAAQILKPIYDSTAGTVFDIITRNDPSTFMCLEYIGRGERRIWDKRMNGEPVVNAFLFLSKYGDGPIIEFALNPEFGTEINARKEALKYANSIGQLPTSLRNGIKRFSIHKGRKGFHAGTGHIIMYSKTAENRLSYDHLEESIFHEAVHASWDAEHRLAPLWVKAQEADGRFLTAYGRRSPKREDLAETALFAFAILHYPARFPPVDTKDAVDAVPNRIAYINRLLPQGKPLVYQAGQKPSCKAAFSDNSL